MERFKKKMIRQLKTMSDKTTIDRIREKLRPEKRVIKKLSNDEKRAMEDEFNKIVEDCNKKYIAIDFEVELHQKQKSENDYLKIINEDKDLGNKDIKEDVEPGVDDNFNLISQNNNIDDLEKDIKQKKQKNAERVYQNKLKLESDLETQKKNYEKKKLLEQIRREELEEEKYQEQIRREMKNKEREEYARQVLLNAEEIQQKQGQKTR